MRTDVITALSTDRQGRGSKRSLWEQTDVLHYRRHALVQFRSFACDHCMPCIQAVADCLTCILFVDSLMDPCARITASAIPRFPRRSPPNGRAGCAPRSSRGWRLDLSIDGQRSRRAPELPDSNRLPGVRSAQEISVGVRRSKTLVGEISVGVRRSKTHVGEISVGVRRSKTLVGKISVGVQRSKTLVGEISVGVRKLKVPALGLIANLTRLPCAPAAAFGMANPQVLLGVYLEAGVAFITQW